MNIYPDTVLFIIGAVCVAMMLASTAYFIMSTVRGRGYRDFERQEREYTARKSTLKLSRINTETSRKLERKSEKKSTKKLDMQKNTEPSRESASNDNLSPDYSINTKVFSGKYEIEDEISGGGMSRVFIARNVRLGNKWIIKFVPHELGAVTYEHEKLKVLTHRSLPQIIDIFDDEKGVYLVESYIEGETLADALEFESNFNYFTLIDYMNQLCGVYSYLHNLPDSPIYHFDIKPSNIMITHGETLVPIDFGISKRANYDSGTIAAVSPDYSAPEQFGNTSNPEYREIMNRRFGSLPEDFVNWKPDARTDIFGLGALMFELATGKPPEASNISLLRDAVPSELSNIILKCIEINPAERYQTMDNLSDDLRELDVGRTKIHQGLLMRKVSAALAAFLFVASGSSFAGGAYIYGQESLSEIGVEPQFITLSLQKSSELKIEKEMPDGKIVSMNANDLVWVSDYGNIAQIDGSRILGINTGEAIIRGRYRNKLVELVVNVVEPMDGMVDIVQRYELGRSAVVYGGTTEQRHTDGLLDGEAEFVSPSSICTSDNGIIYVADSGFLRKIKDNMAESIKIEPLYMSPNIVRCNENDVYVLTNEWEEYDGGYSYGIVRLKDNNGEASSEAEELYVTDAVYTAIEDFGFSPNDSDVLYFIERNAGLEGVYLKTMDLQDTKNINTVCKLPDGTKSLTFGDDGTIYLANPEAGIIQYYRDGELKYFAGADSEKAFVDGNAPLFYMPQKIKYSEGVLFVWDFNVMRCISISDSGAAEECITLAGEASPTFSMEIDWTPQPAEDIIFPNSPLMDFTFDSDVGGILLTDPRRGVIWHVN